MAYFKKKNVYLQGGVFSYFWNTKTHFRRHGVKVKIALSKRSVSKSVLLSRNREKGIINNFFYITVKECDLSTCANARVNVESWLNPAQVLLGSSQW
jgi:hypothetical protein